MASCCSVSTCLDQLHEALQQHEWNVAEWQVALGGGASGGSQQRAITAELEVMCAIMDLCDEVQFLLTEMFLVMGASQPRPSCRACRTRAVLVVSNALRWLNTMYMMVRSDHPQRVTLRTACQDAAHLITQKLHFIYHPLSEHPIQGCAIVLFGSDRMSVTH